MTNRDHKAINVNYLAPYPGGLHLLMPSIPMCPKSTVWTLHFKVRTHQVGGNIKQKYAQRSVDGSLSALVQPKREIENA